MPMCDTLIIPILGVFAKQNYTAVEILTKIEDYISQIYISLWVSLSRLKRRVL